MVSLRKLFKKIYSSKFDRLLNFSVCPRIYTDDEIFSQFSHSNARLSVYTVDIMFQTI